MRGRSSIPQRVRETLGENIRRERAIRKMTQAELAKEIGTSQIMVSRFEKGIDSPTVWRCYLIAKVFDTTVERLLTDMEPHVQSIRSEEAIAFGNWLKECLVRNNMTSDDVAEIVGCPVGYIRYIENGWGVPDKNLREALTALFGDTSDSTTETMPNNPISVKMSDGTWISENTGIDTFIEVVKAIGIEKVKKLDLSVNGIPLIADYDYPNKAQRKVETETGTYWIVSGIDQVKKKKILEDIAARLNIDGTVFVNLRT